MSFRFTFLARLMLVSLLPYVAAFGQNTADYRFDVRMENPASYQYHVTFRCPAGKTDQLDVKMPAWTGVKTIRNFQLTKDPSPTALQAAILADWSRGRGKGDE